MANRHNTSCHPFESYPCIHTISTIINMPQYGTQHRVIVLDLLVRPTRPCIELGAQVPQTCADTPAVTSRPERRADTAGTMVSLGTVAWPQQRTPKALSSIAVVDHGAATCWAAFLTRFCDRIMLIRHESRTDWKHRMDKIYSIKATV